MSVEDNLIFPGYKNTVKFDLNSFYVMGKSSRGLAFRQPVTSLMLVGFATPHEAYWLKPNTPKTSNVF